MSISRFTFRMVVTLMVVAGPFGSVLRSPDVPPGDITLAPEKQFRAEMTAYSSSPDET